MGSERRSVRVGLIPLVELEQVGIDLRVEALELPFELALGDIASAVVGGLGFFAVDGDKLAAEEVEVAEK